MARGEHPYSDAFQCQKWREGIPCRCPAWQEFTHQDPVAEGGQVKIVKGCMFQLFVPVMGWAINAAHGVDASVNGVRRDIQEGLERVAQNLPAVVVLPGITEATAANQKLAEGGAEEAGVA